MGIYDRDYSHDNYGGSRGPRMRLAMPSVPPVVMWLLLINGGVFLVSVMIPPLGKFLYASFCVFPASLGLSLQIWRMVTYQFLHLGFWHLLWNMLWLFNFGPTLEQLWGSKKFLIFYLACGAIGGLVYPLLVLMGILGVGTLVGASGAILAVVAAVALIFPYRQIVVMFVFPMQLWLLAVIAACMSLAFFFQGDNAGGQAVHLGGMAAGAVYVLWPKWRKGVQTKSRTVQWESKINRERNFQAEVDRILDKVHNQGIASLTRKEKKMLREATQREQQQRDR